MNKIFCLTAALVLLAGCAIPRPDKVRASEEKKAEPATVQQNDLGPGIMRRSGEIPVLLLPRSFQLMQVIDPEAAEKMGYNRQTIYIAKAKKTDGSQRVVYMNYNGDPYGWSYLMYIDQQY